MRSLTGLPDGIFSDQKSQFGKFWRALQWKMYVLYFMDIWLTLRTFNNIHVLHPLGIFCGYLVYFPRVGKLYQEKSGNPDF
jgi:hypothetical protein